MGVGYTTGSTVFRNWTIKQLIGEGSFGKVYEIERENFGVYRAALKVITVPQTDAELKNAYEEGMDDASVHNYFYSVVEDIVREFVLMNKLKGMTNVVSYEDHEVIPHENGIGWDILIRMELLTPLLTYAYEHPFSRREIIKLGIDMCRALELCQKYNIIHRDIKPENIFVSDAGDFKLGDFGIARMVEKTMSGLSKKGTYSYMAPEVYRGGAYGFGVDIYSLGIVMYRLLNNNRLPFLPPAPAPITYSERETALARRMSGETLSAPINGLGRLGEIVLKACVFDPKERYASPMQMRQELEAIQYDPADAEIIYPSGDELILHENQYVTRKQTAERTPQEQTEEGTQSIFENDIPESTSKTESVFGQSIPRETADSDRTESVFSSVAEPGTHKKKKFKQAQKERKKPTVKKGIWIAIACVLVAAIAILTVPKLLSISSEAPGLSNETLDSEIDASAFANGIISSETIKDQFQYINYDNDSVAITKYIGFEQYVQIPDNIDGIPVTEIAGAAFFKNKQLYSVKIPEGILWIGESVFEGCSYLTEVALPSSLILLGEKAFCDCSSIPYIEIPEGVTGVPQQCFLNCTALTDVTLHEELVDIGYEAFRNCGIKELALPNSVETIHENAFQNCVLETVTLPENLTYLGSCAFADCGSLTEISVPGSVLNIKTKTFYGCYSMKTVILGEGIESIGIESFFALEALENLTLPESLNSIGYSAFGDNGLTEITIPKGVKCVEGYAISGRELENVYILGPETELQENWIVSMGMGLNIHGYHGSTAEAFVSENPYSGLTFVTLD